MAVSLRRKAAGVVLLLAAVSTPLLSQHDPSLSAGGQLIVAFRHHDPVPIARSLSELRIVQPLLALRASAGGGRLALHAIADFEGLTIPNGELTIGTWGEGFVDRRHPHTYLHELMVTFSPRAGPLRVSLGAGKGFVPFGTDDPMTRPALSYPANHHLSQILERVMILVALGAGPLVLEAAAFNGDEPASPDDLPALERFGDSWAARLTFFDRPAWEAQVSHASVASPEHLGGAGPVHTKWSAALRWTGRWGRTPGELLAEWARTSEAEAFAFHTVLLEASAALGGARGGGRHRPYARFERTERPEEERVAAFRTRRPPLDNSILAITRWTLWTLGYRHLVRVRAAAIEPFIEGTLARVAPVGGDAFDPSVYYGDRTVAGLAVGVRLAYGLENHRMGRYGIALPAEHAH